MLSATKRATQCTGASGRIPSGSRRYVREINYLAVHYTTTNLFRQMPNALLATETRQPIRASWPKDIQHSFDRWV